MTARFFGLPGVLVASLLAIAAPEARSSSSATPDPPENMLPEIRVPQVHLPVKIDGRAGDPVWSRAASITLHDFWGKTDTPPARRTRVLLLHDNEKLYLAFDCEDHDILAMRTAKDDQTFRDDCVEIMLGAPVERLADAACLEINALGTLAAFWYRHADWINYRFDPKVEIAVSRAPVTWGPDVPGYRVELAIPLAPLYPVVGLFTGEGASGAVDRFPEKLRANFARWDRNGSAAGGDRFTIWSNPQFPFPHPHRPERYGWLLLDRDGDG
ncbi:MAG: carbohydrate-binding family 9-like protein [Opitutaceae bacterium]|jgi:hypothetical protein|nr:carbohydrate-binding family 9-like protein [Opitutaceae bacterium]